MIWVKGGLAYNKMQPVRSPVRRGHPCQNLGARSGLVYECSESQRCRKGCVLGLEQGAHLYTCKCESPDILYTCRHAGVTDVGKMVWATGRTAA